MRVTNYTLSASFEETVNQIASEYQVDTFFAEDLIALIATKGVCLLPPAKLAQQLRAAVRGKDLEEGRTLFSSTKKRYAFFRKLQKSPLWEPLVDHARSNGTESAVQKVLSLFNLAFQKKARAQCYGCPLQQTCPYGKFIVGRESRVPFSPDVHADCPVYSSGGQPAPTLLPGSVGALAIGGGFLISLLTPANVGFAAKASQNVKDLVVAFFSESEEGGAPAKTNAFNVSFTGAAMLGEVSDLLRSLSKSELIVFEMAARIEEELADDVGDELERTQVSTSKSKSRSMEEYSDVARSSALDRAMPATIRSMRIATKQLQVRQHFTPVGQKNLYYLLIDSSGSMSQVVSPNKYAFLTRGQMSVALTLAVVGKAHREGGIVHLRFFEGKARSLETARNAEQLVHLTRRISMNDFNGGGTSISGALSSAYEDIQRAGKGDDLRKAEVLLITDAEDTVDEAAMLRKKGSVKLHTVVIQGGRRSPYGNASAVLKKNSDKFRLITPDNFSSSVLAEVVDDKK